MQKIRLLFLEILISLTLGRCLYLAENGHHISFSTSDPNGHRFFRVGGTKLRTVLGARKNGRTGLEVMSETINTI